MVGLLLYTQTENWYLVPMLWGIGILILVVLIVTAYLQRRTGIRLNHELQELDKARQSNIEYEFILRAMKIATWHMDPVNRLCSYDADFRDGKNSYTTTPDTPLEMMWDYLEKNDCERVRVALDDLLAGRANYYHQVYRVRLNNKGLTYWRVMLR